MAAMRSVRAASVVDRSDGGRVAQAQSRWGRRPARGTSWSPGSSPSPAPQTGTPSPGPVGLLREEGRGFFQDLPLRLEDLDPAAQLDELGALIAAQRAARWSGLVLTDPDPERLVGEPEIHGDLAKRLARRPGEPHGLGLELGRERASGRSHRTPSCGSVPLG